MNSSATPLEIDCRTVKDWLGRSEKFLFLDCREQDEHELVRIEGARLIPMSELQLRVGELNAHRDEPIVVHCHHGGRSLRVANWLRQQGYAEARSMAGGIEQWAQEIDTRLARY